MRPTITAAMCARGRGLAEPRLSPDGATVAFLSTGGGRSAVVTVPVVGGPEVTVTADPGPIGAGAYSGGAHDWAGSDALVFASGDGRLYTVAAAGGPPRPVVEQGPASCPAVSPDGRRVAYLAGDARHVAVAALDEGGPWPVRLSAGADFCLDPAWSPDGELVAWHEWDVPAMPWDAGRIVVAPSDGSAPPVTVAGGAGIAVAQPRFSPAGRVLAFLCDLDGWLNLWLAEPDGSGGWAARSLVKEEVEHGDPSWGPGQRSYAWSPDGRHLAFARNEAGFGSLCVTDVATGEVRELERGVHGGLSWAGDHLVAVRGGARTPTQLVAIPAPTAAVPADAARAAARAPRPSRPGSPPPPGSRRVLATGPVAGFAAATGFVEPHVVQWTGVDGGDVNGRLYRPHEPPGGLELPPLLLWVHGGPTGQTRVDFNASIAYFVDRGYAVLVPDYRGSTGWGRAYTQALAGRWGDLDVADCAAGLRAAAERRWGDPRRMVPIGGSAGGFTVLLLLARHGDLCAAGVDRYGVTDLLDLDETTHRFEAHYLQSVVGPLPGAADRYRDRSPVSVVESIRAPLLVLQGSADKVVPKAQSEAMVRRLEALGRTVEYHEYEGEGHGWSRPETVADELERIESFLRRHVLRWRA